MMRSLYAGVSGLQNHQVKMDVLGNNISNVNTIGFKKGRVTFQDMISQNMAGASKPTEELGGVNPKQIGLGMSVASIDTIHTQGSLQTTGVREDLAIQGEGFFVLKNGEKEVYTRAGAFGVDKDGTFVNPATGFKVQGWSAEIVDGETIVNTAADPGDLYIPIGGKDAARATTEVEYACNLQKTTPVIQPGASPAEIAQGTWTVTKDVYDSFGEKHKLRVDFIKDPDFNNQWIATATIDAETAAGSNARISIGGAEADGNEFRLQFDNFGTLQRAFSGDDINGGINTGDLNVQITYDVQGSNVDTATEGFQQQTFNLNLGEVGSNTSSITQYGSASSTKAFAQDGYSMGYLENFQIDQSGNITGIYSNGTNRVLGQVALATFTNPGGLEKSGETNFVVSNNSGDANIGPSGIAGKGKFISGALEMSNVDLAGEFTDMIVTQRGFQANSKTITTSDQMLQELLTLKR